MKEIQIAKENVAILNAYVWENTAKDDCRKVLMQHLQSCQREKEFLINILKTFAEIGMGGYECDELCKYKYCFMGEGNKRIKDLQDAIKIYKEVGLK